MPARFLARLGLHLCFILLVAAAAPGSGSPPGPLADTVEQMSIEEKVGQLFIVQVYGATATDPNYRDENLATGRGAPDFASAIAKYHLGGVIYFNHTGNIPRPLDAKRVLDLSNSLQQLALEQPAAVPLFIAVDQETGNFTRVLGPATVFTGNMSVAATGSVELSRRVAAVTAQELHALGINLNLAPVMDVNTNPHNPLIGVRSFSDDPQMVSDFGSAQIKEYGKDVGATAKHFPGHGSTSRDSHTSRPVVTHDRATLEAVDLPPFEAAIDAGVGSVMSGHVSVPAVDPSGLPATLSRPILTDLLRSDLAFDGVVMTDSLAMDGVRVRPKERVPVMALEAGADVLLMPPDVEVAYEAVIEAVRAGDISEERLDTSVLRILELKDELGLFDDPLTSVNELDSIGSEENRAVARETAERSITLIENRGVLPLREGSRVLVTGPARAKPRLLSKALNNVGIDSSAYPTRRNPSPRQTKRAVRLARRVDVVVATTFDALENGSQPGFVRALKQGSAPLVVAAMHNPYDIRAFPSVDAYVAAYSFRYPAIEALARVLVGDVQPSGRLPVNVSEDYPRGSGTSF